MIHAMKSSLVILVLLSCLSPSVIFRGRAESFVKAATSSLQERKDQAVNVRDYGVKGNGVADDTAAFQSAIDAAPNHSMVVIPPGMSVKLSATIRIWGRRGVTITGPGGGSYSAGPNAGQTHFIWDGPQGGTMLSVMNSASCIIENFGLLAKGPRSYADVAIDIDQSRDKKYGQGVTSDIYLNRIFIQRQDNSAKFVGIRIAETSKENCEQIRMQNVTILASGDAGFGDPTNMNRGTCIKIGDSANAKNISLIRSYLGAGVYGVKMLNGSLFASDIESHWNTYDYDINNSMETTTIEYHITENGRQFARIGNGDFILRANSIASTGYDHVHAGIEVFGNAHLLMEKNVWTADPAAIAIKGTDSAALVSIANRYPSQKVDFASFSTGYVTMMDDIGGLTPRTEFGPLKIVLGATPFELLNLSPLTNGSMVFCKNCDPSNGLTCTSAGAKTGAMAMRINNAWKCY